MFKEIETLKLSILLFSLSISVIAAPILSSSLPPHFSCLVHVPCPLVSLSPQTCTWATLHTWLLVDPRTGGQKIFLALGTSALSETVTKFNTCKLLGAGESLDAN